MDFMKDVVDIQITNTTGNTNTTDLNTILIIAKHSQFTAPELFREYRSALQAKADGFTVNTYVYKALELAFSQKRIPSKVLVSRGVAEEGSYTDMFEQMQMLPVGWLWLISDLRDTAKQLELAKLVQTTEKFYCIGSSDPVALTAEETDISSLTKALDLSQVYCWYDAPDADLGDYSASEMALLARCAGDVAGTVQFSQKELVGVLVPKTIVRPSQMTTLTAKGYTFPAIGNGKVSSYGSGKLANGEWIDIGLAITWIKVNIRERVFNALTNIDKLPMENDGASVIEGIVRSTLMEARDLGMIAKDSPIVVTVPDVTTMTKVQRAERKLPNVFFSARLSGAIVAVQIRGEVYE